MGEVVIDEITNMDFVNTTTKTITNVEPIDWLNTVEADIAAYSTTTSTSPIFTCTVGGSDFVHVTRCKNCIHCKHATHGDGEDYLECELTQVMVEEDDYCSCGEEK